MKERKVSLIKIVVSICSIALIAFMIWLFVGLGDSSTYQLDVSTFVSAQGEIGLRDARFLSVSSTYNDDVVTVEGYFTEESNPDNITVKNINSKIFQYKLTISKNSYYETSYKIKSTDVYYSSYTEEYKTSCTIKDYLLLNMQQTENYFSGNSTIAAYATKGTFFVYNEENYTEDAFLSMLPSLIFYAVIFIAGFFFVRMLAGSVNKSNNSAIDFNKSRARRVDTSKVKFSDVAGCEEEKLEMMELVDYLKNPTKYSKNGAKLPKGILLVGNPGTGKTLLAKAVAGEAKVPFFSVSGSDFVEMFVGVGAGRVRDMFRTAKQNAPCLLFIDEIDAVGRQRGTGLGGGNDEREQTLNQLLVEMDGFEENTGVLVLAATNRDDVLDPALLRAGRFDRKITVSLPDKKAREEIFKVHARGKNIDPSVSFADLAKRTVGFSGADIAAILNDAAILSIRNNEEKITLKDIDEAIDRRIAGPAKSSRTMTALERKEVAYHEAGHAIIGLTLPASDKVQKITIVPRGNTGGHVLMTPENDRFLLSKTELEAKIIGYLGGRSSEEIFFDDVTTGASNDIEMATRIARSMVVEYGMSALGPIQYESNQGSVFLGRDYASTSKNFSAEVAKEIDNEVRKIIDYAHSKAVKIIKDRREDVILIAETLLEVETITAEQIDYLLEHRTLEGFGAPLALESIFPTEPTEENPAPTDENTKK